MNFRHTLVCRRFLCASAFWAGICFAQTPAGPLAQLPEKPQKPSPIMQSVDPSQLGAIQKYAPCAVNAPAGYHGGNCRIQIWRGVPISPPTTLSLPAGTHVYVELFEVRQNENVAFTLTTQATGPHQVGPTLLPTVIPGLNTITFSSPIPTTNQQRHTFLERFAPADIAKVPPPAQQLAAEIEARQSELVQKTNKVLNIAS